jgi:hypothetical protein
MAHSIALSADPVSGLPSTMAETAHLPAPGIYRK